MNFDDWFPSAKQIPIYLDVAHNRFNFTRVDTSEQAQLVRQVLCKWEPHTKAWHIPVSVFAAEQINQLIKDNSSHFVISPNASYELQQGSLLAKQQRIASTAKTASLDSRLDGFGSPGYALKPYQIAGIKYALAGGNTLFADPMGLGKTCQILGTLYALKAFPVFAVTRAGLKENLKEEIALWLPNAKVQILDNQSTVLPKQDIYILNYEILSGGFPNTKAGKHKKEVTLSAVVRDVLSMAEIQAVVLDECHKIKNSKSQMGLAINQICAKIEHIFFASGTPAPNCPLELVNTLKCLRKIEHFGGEWNFKLRYCNGQKVRRGRKEYWDFSGSSNLEELYDKLRVICMVRRDKREVLPELPEKHKIKHSCQLSNKQEYDKIQKNVIQHAISLKLQAEVFANTLVGLDEIEKMAQILNFKRSETYRLQFQKALLEFGYLRRIVGTGKIHALVDHAEEVIAEGRKVIIFAYFRENQKLIIEELEKRGIKTAKIAGDLSGKERAQEEARFKQEPDCMAFVVSIKAGAEGLNLVNASDVLFLETDLVADTQEQCEARAWRLGQKREVEARYFVAHGTIDDKIWALLDGKEAITNAMYGDTEERLMRELAL